MPLGHDRKNCGAYAPFPWVVRLAGSQEPEPWILKLFAFSFILCYSITISQKDRDRK